MEFLNSRRQEKCPKPQDLLHYWPQLIEGMSFSTKEFYERTEAALDARQTPELEVSRVDIKEGGPMSARREYLRLRRERLVFDICAMPFGSGFYVSEWFWEQPRRMGLVLLLTLGGLVLVAVTMGILYAMLAVIVGLIVGVLWFGEAVDGMLMRIPLVGYVYENYIRRITYYREDRTNAFQAAAHEALCCVIDSICKTQGIAPLSDAAKRPMNPQIKPNIGPLRPKPPTAP